MEWPKLTFFGDSITRRANDVNEGCWGSMIESRVGHYFDVDYRGFEGYNTKWACDLLSQLFPPTYLEKVQILVVFFGHNDSWDCSSNPLGIPIDQFEANYRAMIKYFQHNRVDESRMILITPTWYHADGFVKFLASMNVPPSGKTLEHAKLYSDVVQKLGIEFGIQVVDMFSVSKQHEPIEDLFCDGVHYSRLGAKMLFDILFPVIKKKIEFQYGKPLAEILHAPLWADREEVADKFAEFRKKESEAKDD